MTPWVDIRIDGAAAAAALTDRLLSLRATDEAGLEADLLEITLDARDGIEPPRRGVEITLALGLREILALNEKQETQIVNKLHKMLERTHLET